MAHAMTMYTNLTVTMSRYTRTCAVLFTAKYEKRGLTCADVGRVVQWVATGYGPHDPGIESRWGRDFPHLSTPALGTTQPPVQWVPDLSRG
jgi:hypothetical protein